MDLLCSSHCHRILLHAQPRPGGSQWVSSQAPNLPTTPTPLSPDDNVRTLLLTKNLDHKKFRQAKTFREFSNERTRVERRETFRKLRIKENFYESINGYFDWISTAGSDY